MKRIVFVYANDLNPGDRESYMSIRNFFEGIKDFELVGLRFEQDKFADYLKSCNLRNTYVIVGGGGLFKRYFKKMWEEVLKFKFFLWGVGLNFEYTNFTDRLYGIEIKQILLKSSLSGLRDYNSCDYAKRFCEVYYTGCPSIVRVYDYYKRISATMRDSLAYIPSPFYKINKQFKNQLKTFSKGVGLNFIEIDHYSLNTIQKIVNFYSQSKIVVSPRLHSCIFGFTCENRIISWNYNPKVSSFFSDAEIKEFMLPAFSVSFLPHRTINDVLKVCNNDFKNQPYINNIIDSNKEYFQLVLKKIKE